MSAIVKIICALQAALFTYAAVSKLAALAEFRLQLGRSPLLAGYEGLLAAFLPLAELVTALLLVISFTRRAGLYAAFGLLLAFTGYLLIILNYSYYVPCSCGGILGHLSWKAHIYFNGAFILLAIIAILIDQRQKGGAASNP
jgi:hypothetical protein